MKTHVSNVKQQACGAAVLTVNIPKKSPATTTLYTGSDGAAEEVGKLTNVEYGETASFAASGSTATTSSARKHAAAHSAASEPAATGSAASGPTAASPADSEQTSAQERAIANKLAAVGVFGNIALSAFKLFAGIFGNSTAMISDAVHSLSDVLATAIAWTGVRISSRKADTSHPYGHERFESLASLALGLILVATGLGIGWSSLQSIISGAYLSAPAPTALALAAALVGIATKEAMFWYTRHWAQVMNSSAFMADAWHHRSDAISCIGALLGILGSMAGFPICDPLASIAICVIILKVAYDVLHDAIDKMTDTPCSPEFEAQVSKHISAEPGVVRIDSLRTRQFGNKAYIDAEIAVDGSLPLTQAHSIAEAVHNSVEQAFPNVKHIMIHENPADTPAA